MFKLFRRRRGGGKDILYVKLCEAMESHGCPICNLLLKAERELIEEILYEHVQDPQVRSKLRESLGLCPYHAWLLHDVALSRPEMDGLGTTIIYEDMLSTYYEALVKGREEEVGLGKCMICEHILEFEEGYIGAFAERTINSDILRRYRESPSILCIRHVKALEEVLRSMGNEGVKALDELKGIQGEKIEGLIKDMKEYIRKQDYLVKEEVTPEEAMAWRIALQTLKGGRVSVNIMGIKPLRPRRGFLRRISK